MISCLFGRFAYNRNVQLFSNDFRNISERNSLFSNPVIPGSRGTLLNREPVEMTGIEAVHGGPTIEPCAYIRRNALFTCDVDEHWDEAVIAGPLDVGWS